MTCTGVPNKAQRFRQTRCSDRCGWYGYIVKAMLAWQILLLSTMARLVLYTRSVSVIQSEPLLPPGSRAAQRRETPGDRFKEK